MSTVSWSFPLKGFDARAWSAEMRFALKHHWPEYLIEAAGLCSFMLSACAFGTLLFHPASAINRAVGDPLLLRALMGVMMALTAAAIIYSPWGKRSGAHTNPSVTLAFLRLGKIEPVDALFYVVAQFAGAILGVLIAGLLLGRLLADPMVNYVTTVGSYGAGVAFVAELLISLILMSVVLVASNAKRLERLTGLFAALLVAIYISLEAPLSGMSMNPARTFGSALSAQFWTALWVYFTAPPAGMLLAAEIYTRMKGKDAVACAKLHHRNNQRCIFRCGYERVVSEKKSASVLN
ncbi:MAG TPA: aquaporin [Pyrinomonadaceae bacterium]|nr:aquaporin [Pyrinomonadaceae bacterium]